MARSRRRRTIRLVEWTSRRSFVQSCVCGEGTCVLNDSDTDWCGPTGSSLRWAGTPLDASSYSAPFDVTDPSAVDAYCRSLSAAADGSARNEAVYAHCAIWGRYLTPEDVSEEAKTVCAGHENDPNCLEIVSIMNAAGVARAKECIDSNAGTFQCVFFEPAR